MANRDWVKLYFTQSRDFTKILFVKSRKKYFVMGILKVFFNLEKLLFPWY